MSKKTSSNKKNNNKNTPKSHQDVVVTSSEADAMCVFQQTSRPSIALPKGSSVLPPKVLGRVGMVHCGCVDHFRLYLKGSFLPFNVFIGY